MHNAKFKIQVMRAIVAAAKREVNKKSPSKKKTAQLKKLENARKIINIMAKHT